MFLRVTLDLMTMMMMSSFLQILKTMMFKTASMKMQSSPAFTIILEGAVFMCLHQPIRFQVFTMLQNSTAHRVFYLSAIAWVCMEP